MSRDKRFDDMNLHVYHPKFMKKEGGGKWDFQLVSKRVDVAMPVTAGDDDKLTTASHGINCRTIWEAQTWPPRTPFAYMPTLIYFGVGSREGGP